MATSLICLAVLMLASYSKAVTAEQVVSCAIEAKITMFAKPIATDKVGKDCDCYQVTIITIFHAKSPDIYGIKLQSAAKPLANLLGLEQGEVTHYCSKVRIAEDGIVVVMKSCFYAELNRLKEKFDSNNDEIFSGLVEGDGCWVKKTRTTMLFLLDNQEQARPKKELEHLEGKVKKHDI